MSLQVSLAQLNYGLGAGLGLQGNAVRASGLTLVLLGLAPQALQPLFESAGLGGLVEWEHSLATLLDLGRGAAG